MTHLLARAPADMAIKIFLNFLSHRNFSLRGKTLLFFSLSLLSIPSLAKADANWYDLTQRLGKGAGDHRYAVQRLHEIKNLSSVLIESLNTEKRAFALEAIAALQLVETLPALLKSAEHDKDGFLILTINALLTAENQERVLNKYKILLVSRKSSSLTPSAIAAMLEPMGRLGALLPRPTVAHLLRHEFPEVQSSTINYIRKIALKYRRRDYVDLLNLNFHNSTLQVRLQSSFFLQELQQKTKDTKKLCKNEKSDEVKIFCLLRKPPNSPASKTDIGIRIVFGYKDSRPARFVGDRHERLAFVQKILEACKANDENCGFKRDLKNADLFFKEINSSEKQMVRVTMLVVHSSVDSDDHSNRKNPFQTWQSLYAKQSFFDGLKENNVLFYNGHSRYGGGPDFHPPILKDGSKVDILYYTEKKMKLKELQKEILKASTRFPSEMPRFLGFFSCSSNQHFKQAISDFLPKDSSVTLLTSDSSIHYSRALSDSLEALSTVLSSQILRSKLSDQVKSNFQIL